MAKMFYNGSLATAATSTTNATPNTETDIFFVKAGTRTVDLTQVTLQGMASAASTIAGMTARAVKFGTASTAGTTVTPSPVDPGIQAAKSTSASGPTVGTTRVNHFVTGCSAGGNTSWIPVMDGAGMTLEGSGALSMDLISSSGLASFPYSWSYVIAEQ